MSDARGTFLGVLSLLVACGGGSGGSADGGSGVMDASAADAGDAASGHMDASAADAGDAASGHVCVNVSLVGQPCGNTDDCDPASYCLGGSCLARPGVGEPCGDGVYCAEGLGCDFDLAGGGSMLCAPLPGEGEPCALSETGPSLCAPGLGCRMLTCGPLPGEGEPCTVDNRCAGDLGCDFRTDGSFCAPRRAAGEACASDAICAAGTYCDFGSMRCTPYEANGTTCSDGNECGPMGSCVPDASGRFRCVTLPGAGEPCFFDCAPGLTCAG